MAFHMNWNWSKIPWLGVQLSKEEGLRRTFTFAYLATATAQICEICYNYVLYRHFSVGEIGLLNWSAALIVFVNMAVDLGVEPILIRRFSQSTLELGPAIKATLIPRLPLVIAAALVAVWLHVSGILSHAEWLLLMLIGAQIIFNFLDGALRAWLRAHGRQTATNMVSAYVAALKLAAIVALTATEGATIAHVMGWLVVIRAVGSWVLYRAARSVRPQTPAAQAPALGKLIADLLRAGVVIGGINTLTAVQNRLDWLLVSTLVSAEALASYSLANKLFEISQVIIGVAITALYPRLCRDATAGDSTYSLVLRSVVLVGVLLASAGMLVAPPLIEALFAGKYAGVDAAARLLMLAVGFMSASGVFYNLILSRGMDRSLLRTAVLTTAAQTACNLWLIPRMGIDGAAIGMVLLLVSTALALAYVAHGRGLLAHYVVCRILLLLALFWIAPSIIASLGWHILFAVPACTVFTGALGWLLLFDPMERVALKHLVRGRKAADPGQR